MEKNNLGYNPNDFIVMSVEENVLTLGVNNFGLINTQVLTYFFHKGTWYKRVSTGVIPWQLADRLCSVQIYEAMDKAPVDYIMKELTVYTKSEMKIINWCKQNLRVSLEDLMNHLFFDAEILYEGKLKLLSRMMDGIMLKSKSPNYRFSGMVLYELEYEKFEDSSFYSVIVYLLSEKIARLGTESSNFEVIEGL